MPWLTRGLRDGVLTSRYPGRPDGYGANYRASVAVVAGDDTSAVNLEGLCPTAAISNLAGHLRVDQGRCILCGRCVAARPDRFAFVPDIEVAAFHRDALVVPDDGNLDAEAVEETRRHLAQRVRALRRSVHIRHVDAGSDGSEEWEIAALNNPVYDIQRLGVFFTASPRHADLLLVTGAGAAGMAGPLRRTWAAMPDPKIAVAAGTDAISGGLLQPGYATRGGVSSIVPIDVWIPGSPPSPFSLLHGILAAVRLLGDRTSR